MAMERGRSARPRLRPHTKKEARMESSVTVLVVEDEPLVRMMAAEIFADALRDVDAEDAALVA
ncbi:hypothetical protein ATN00_22250 (plasmid) [Sphingobium baderi]|uniref:Uncharacterized protein n=2 Tax=Sphingobium TaxID=165695 RepID=A0A0S3F6A2_9SPHN|nr:hypothetical protein ATN00_22250 [Sphingobium baderi]